MDPQGNQWAATANQREMQLLAMIEELRTQVQELQHQSRTKTRQVLPEPERFAGRTKDWDTWSMTMRAKLCIDGNVIGSNEAQFYYVYSSLSSKIQGLILNFVRQAQERGEWEPLALLDHLGRSYDDPNKAKKAGQRLMEFRQGTTAIVAYIPQFEKVMFEAGANSWPDDAKITTLVGGLNKYTRQRIDGQLTLPTDYNDFVRMLQTLGNQFGSSYGNGNDNGQRNGNTMEWEPIKASTAKTAPSVSREQRQAWRDQGKCVRCGSNKHWVNACNNQPTRSRSSSVSSDGSNGEVMIRASAVQVGRTKTTAKPTHTNDKGEPDSQWTRFGNDSGNGFGNDSGRERRGVM
jgi:Retrotransposon gag protein